MLTRQMKEFYDTNGFLVADELFGSDEIEAVKRRTEELVADPKSAPEGVSIGRELDTLADPTETNTGNNAIRGMAFLVRFDLVFHDLAIDAKLLDIVRGLVGPRVKLFRDQMLLKPPGGQAKPPHQDQSYFRVQPVDSLVTAWVALDDATISNGCMRYVPGSHLYGIFPIDTDPERPVHHVPDTGALEFGAAVSCPVSAGSVIFHHGCTLHASAVNTTKTWRRAVIFHYTGADSVSDHEYLNAEISLEID